MFEICDGCDTLIDGEHDENCSGSFDDYFRGVDAPIDDVFDDAGEGE